MEVAINGNLYQEAQAYAQKQGLNLTTVIEEFLLHIIGKSQNAQEETVPDVVLSLLGAGEAVDDDDLNGDKARMEYLREKYASV